ncbi:MAG: endopeptidase La [Ruminococcaceae bacterium]|nr:endopeptidase La [Oscillospiraceae bacterium]
MAIKKSVLPIIPVRGFVIFPKTVFHFDIAREKSKNAVLKAISADGLIFLAAQKNENIEQPTESDVNEFGVVAKIKQFLKLPDGCIRILVEGVSRGKLVSPFLKENIYEGEVIYKNSSDKGLSLEEYSAILNQIHFLINDYIEFNPKLATEPFLKDLPETNPSEFCDTVASNLIRSNEDKQLLLETTNVKKRLVKLLDIMTKEIKILDIESIISAKIKEQMDDNNHEYYLREQLKAIHNELGDDKDDEVSHLRDKLESIPLPDEVYSKAMRELKSYEKLPPTSPESNISRHYLELICELPWDTYTEENSSLENARNILERDHYGMVKVKDRIIEQLAVINHTNNPCGSVLCLLGAPGVGKTSIAKSIAEATGRSFVRLSLGGMKDESELRGHRKTYVGAMPGRIVTALRQAKSSNPLILLDEIDKIGADYKGDPASALLEILDSEQNMAFRDNYLEIGIDLSKVLFLATANDTSTIPSPLLDRMEILELSSYTAEEKFNIAKNHLLPKQIKKHGLEKKSVKITDDALKDIISSYTRESGVRKLEREIAAICRKCVVAISQGKKSISVNEKNIEDYLGIRKYTDSKISPTPTVGLVNGLAWTQVGGEVLQCEVISLSGSGKTQITGKLGDVMKESVQTALSFIRSISETLGIEPDFYKKRDIHIHFPEGAVPKDGPSAGITVATAVASALSQIPVRSDIAMTGEISLQGRVMAIGGLKEKVLAAYRYGIKNIIIPRDNFKDIEEIPLNIRNDITFHVVENCNEVLKIALLSKDLGIKTESFPPQLHIERSACHEYS